MTTLALYDALATLICLALPFLFYRKLERQAAERRRIEERLAAVIRGGR